MCLGCVASFLLFNSQSAACRLLPGVPVPRSRPARALMEDVLVQGRILLFKEFRPIIINPIRSRVEKEEADETQCRSSADGSKMSTKYKHKEIP